MMMKLAFLTGLFLFLVAWLIYKRRPKPRKLLSAECVTMFEAEIPGWANLAAPHSQKHLDLVCGFLMDKNFELCQGAVITERTCQRVAGLACMLWLRFEGPAFPGLRSILVYPGDFKSSRVRPLAHGAWLEEKEARTGESWDSGTVILGGLEKPDGALVTVHEFAHQLDNHDSHGTDGNPPFPEPGILKRWEQEWPMEKAALRAAIERGEEGWLDEYALENDAEFFAVAVETFMYDGNDLKVRRPQMYGLLSEYFGFETGTL